MKLCELKHRQTLKDKRTGEKLQVSKRWNGVYLLDQATKRPKYRLDFHPTSHAFDWLEPA